MIEKEKLRNIALQNGECPECFIEHKQKIKLVMQEGCKKCPVCFWEGCGV